MATHLRRNIEAILDWAHRLSEDSSLEGFSAERLSRRRLDEARVVAVEAVKRLAPVAFPPLELDSR
jgi:hypothetical protein